MTPFQRMMQALSTGQGGSTRFVKPIADWLRGQPLTDPGAIAWLRQFYPDLSQAGKDGSQTVGAIVTEPSTVGSAVKEGPSGSGLAAGAGSAMYNSVPNAPSPAPTTTPAGRAGLGSPTISFAPGGGDAPPVRSVPEPGISFRPGGGGPAMNPVPSPSAAPTQQQPERGSGSAATPSRSLPEGGGGSPVNPAVNPGGGGGGGPVPGGGGISDVQGMALGPGGDNNFRLRQALQAAGIDPYSRGLRTQYLKQALAKQIAARAEMLGLEGNGADPTSYLDTLKNTVLSFITPGQSGFGGQRALAQQIAGGSAFQNALANADDTNAQGQMYQNLFQMLYGGENPAIQSGVQNVFGDEMNRYQDRQVMSNNPFMDPNDPTKEGLFSQYANRDPQSRIAQILRGMYGR